MVLDALLGTTVDRQVDGGSGEWEARGSVTRIGERPRSPGVTGGGMNESRSLCDGFHWSGTEVRVGGSTGWRTKRRIGRVVVEDESQKVVSEVQGFGGSRRHRGSSREPGEGRDE